MTYFASRMRDIDARTAAQLADAHAHAAREQRAISIVALAGAVVVFAAVALVLVMWGLS